MNVFENNSDKLRYYIESKALQSVYPSPDAPVTNTLCRRQKKASHKVAEIEWDEGLHKNVITARDCRIRIENTAEWPYSVHGIVAVSFHDTYRWGTGVLIGPNIVLTAGHLLYSHADKAYANLEKMQFLPGVNGYEIPFGFAEVEQCFVSEKYIKEEKEDYGILILKKPIGEVTGYFGLAFLNPGELKKKKINITGYPAEKVELKPNTYEMWGMEGEASHIDQDKGLINYLIDTGPGQDGSAVWFQEGEDYYVCGVHVSGNMPVNSATLLTQTIYKQIFSWLSQAFQERNILWNNIKKLALPYYTINAESLSVLIEYDFIELTTMNLSSKKLGTSGTKVLAQNISWENLAELSLGNNNIDAEGAKALAQNTSWINLSKLDLNWNNIGAEGVKALAQNSSWINISQLNLSNNRIGAEGVKALAQNTFWINLSQLNLSWNNIDAEGAKALAQNTSWINLSKLNLWNNKIGAEGAKALAQNTSWINLSQLNLWNNNIGAEGAKALAQNTSWINLSQLDLSNNNIGAEGAKALAQNTSWINLSQLDLSNSEIGDEGAKALAQNTSWTNLSQLDLWNNEIGTE